MPLCSLFQPTPDSATNPPDFGQSVLSHPDTLEFIRVWGILNTLFGMLDRSTYERVTDPINAPATSFGVITYSPPRKNYLVKVLETKA